MHTSNPTREPLPVCVIGIDERHREGVVSLINGLTSQILEFSGAADFQSRRPARALCVVADLGLPGGGAIELLRTLRAQGDRTPFLILDERAEVEMAVAAMRAGATDFIEYGLMQRPLQRQITRLLAQDRMPPAN